MIAVVIVDDHPVVRTGMRAVLEAAADITVVAEGASGADALRLASQHHPDVLVLDVNLPDLNGLEVTQRLREGGSATAILVLTIHDDSQIIFGLLDSGAAVASQVVRRAVKQPAPYPEPPPLPLTPRELQVLRLLAQGLDNATIAQRLVVTKRTVQNHVSNIYGKLGVASRTEAALIAIRHGLVQVPPAGEEAHGP